MAGDGDFEKKKAAALSAVDLSRKGSVDEDIVGLVDYINNNKSYFTTSSCSGRIVLFCESDEGIQKKGCKWLHVWHKEVSPQDLITALDPCQGDNVLKFEPFVLHVQCKTLEDAKLMHTCAVESGFRNSGMSIGKKGKIIQAVRSTHGLEVPLSHCGKLIVSHEYVEHVMKKANAKLEVNGKRVQQFYQNLQGRLTKSACLQQENREPRTQQKSEGLTSSRSDELCCDHDRSMCSSEAATSVKSYCDYSDSDSGSIKNVNCFEATNLFTYSKDNV